MIMKNIFISLVAALCLLGCAQKPYVIVQLADVQLGFTAADDSQRNGTEYVNDLTFEVECLKKAVALVNEIKPDAVVFSGDQVHRTWIQEQWTTFESHIADIDPAIKVFHVPGNHDVAFEGDMVDPAPFTERFGPDRFCHTERGVKLVGINTNLIRFSDAKEAEQTEWMKEVLKKGSDDEVTLVFGHHPFFIADIDEEEDMYPGAKEKRHFYFDLFSEMGVDAMYGGHHHSTHAAEYKGVQMKTTTAVGVQLGPDRSAVRVITVNRGKVSDEIIEL
jgi:3',5'-cyclic AMP phosphodiesterase CpdA